MKDGERMNQEQAKAWLPLIQAVAEGKKLQIKHRSLNANTMMRDSPRFKWRDYEGLFADLFVGTAAEFRIKPEQKKGWYRVALKKSDNDKYYTMSYELEEEELWQVNNRNFVRWLTDRIEYELPKGE